MGVGHLDIGENIGGAQVFGQNPAIGMFANMLAQKQAAHEAELKQIGDQLAKGYDPSGLRNDADKQSYIKQYNDIKQQAIDAENEPDRTKKALALSGVRQQLTNLGAYADNSKKQGAFERQIAMSHLNNRYLLDDNSAQNLTTGMQKEWNDPSVIRDASGFSRGVDPSKVDAAYDKHKKTLIAPTVWDAGTLGEKRTVLGRPEQDIIHQRGLPFDGDNGAFENTLHWATSDNDVLKSLHDRYPDIKGPDDKTTTALRVRQYMNDRGDVKGFYDKPQIRTDKAPLPQQPVRFSAGQQWNLAHYGNPNGFGVAVGNEPPPSQTLIYGHPQNVNGQVVPTGGLQQGDPLAVAKLYSILPTGQYGTAKLAPPVINPATGVQTYHFPQVIDPKIQAENEKKIADFKRDYPKNDINDPDYGVKLKNPIKQPAKTYTIDPGSPSYAAATAQMIKEQNGNLSALDKVEGVKSGHGQREEAKIVPKEDNSTVIVTLNGKSGEIPKSKLKDFLKKYPQAKTQ